MMRAPVRAIFAISFLAAACASRAEPPQAVVPETGADHAQAAAEPAHAAMDHSAHMQHGPELPATAGRGFTVADVRFMQNMIGHHAQAIRMSEMAPSRGPSAAVLKLAEKIDISQRDEILFMQQWLRERNQAVPSDEHAHTMMMPGMLTDEQLAQLSAARGQEFDRLFLSFMIGHHEGALLMVDELFASPGAGQDSDIFRFATDVDADQRDEIFVMQKLLDTIREEPR